MTAPAPAKVSPWMKSWFFENFDRLKFYLFHTAKFTWSPRLFMEALSAPAWDWDKKEVKTATPPQPSHESIALRPDRFISWMAVCYVMLLSPLMSSILGKSQEFFWVSLALKLIGFYLYTWAASFVAHLMFSPRTSADSFSKTWSAVVYAYAGPAFWITVLTLLTYKVGHVSTDNRYLFSALPAADASYQCAWKGVFGYLKSPSLIVPLQSLVFLFYSHQSFRAIHRAGFLRAFTAATFATLMMNIVLPALTVLLATLVLWDRAWYESACL